MRTLLAERHESKDFARFFEFLLLTPATFGTAFPLAPCKLLNGAKENYDGGPGKSVV